MVFLCSSSAQMEVERVTLSLSRTYRFYQLQGWQLEPRQTSLRLRYSLERPGLNGPGPAKGAPDSPARSIGRQRQQGVSRAQAAATSRVWCRTACPPAGVPARTGRDGKRFHPINQSAASRAGPAPAVPALRPYNAPCRSRHSSPGRSVADQPPPCRGALPKARWSDAPCAGRGCLTLEVERSAPSAAAQRLCRPSGQSSDGQRVNDSGLPAVARAGAARVWASEGRCWIRAAIGRPKAGGQAPLAATGAGQRAHHHKRPGPSGLELNRPSTVAAQLCGRTVRLRL